MRRRPRRSRPAARPSSASGGSSVERLPIASKKLATTSSLSRACRRASGEAQEQRTRSSVCTKSSSGGLRRRPCCRRPIRRQCCSGRCSPLVKSTCARLTVGRPSPPHNKAINRLTSPPDSVLSKCRRSRQQIPTQFATAPFYEHGGFYLPSLLRATVRNILSGSAREGGSTISQQLARMMYLSPDRTIKRKVQEAIFTLWLERHLGKEEILSRYLNTAYFGAGVYGVDAAAKRYFGKTAKDLSLSEAAMLAGLVRAPSALAPTRNLEGARQRAGLVLNAMVVTGAISRQQADAARQQPATLRVPPENPPGTNYFVDVLNGDVKRLIGPASPDLTLRSTLDLNLQSIGEN